MQVEAPMQQHLRPALILLALLSSTASAASLRGAIIVAADGTFLGTCDGTYGSTSIANEYSQYSGAYGSRSMFNRYSQYGSEYSNYSAFNKYSTNAPYILVADSRLLSLFANPSYRPTPAIVQAIQGSGSARVTINQYVVGAVDPNVLLQACKNP